MSFSVSVSLTPYRVEGDWQMNKALSTYRKLKSGFIFYIQGGENGQCFRLDVGSQLTSYLNEHARQSIDLRQVH